MWQKSAAAAVRSSAFRQGVVWKRRSSVASSFSFSSSSFSTIQPPPTPIVELREYTVHPQHLKAYMQATNESAALRKSISPLRFFSLPETGGPLLVPTHAYYYKGGHADRDASRANMALHDEWNEYLGTIFPFLQSAQSNIYVEAPLVAQVEGVIGLAELSSFPNNDNTDNNQCILELRRYQLQLGYDTVPQFLQYYGEGLPSKLTSPGTDPTTSLVTVMYTEVGRLNEVIEIWRHGNGTRAMERSRAAARSAQEWRSAIANIAGLAVQFTSTIHKPTSFSPLR